MHPRSLTGKSQNSHVALRERWSNGCMGDQEPEIRQRDVNVRRVTRITVIVGTLAAGATAGFGVLAAAATSHVGHETATTTAATRSSSAATQAQTTTEAGTEAATTQAATTAAATTQPTTTAQAPVAVSGGS
jgi:hypothetical protein